MADRGLVEQADTISIDMISHDVEKGLHAVRQGTPIKRAQDDSVDA